MSSSMLGGMTPTNGSGKSSSFRSGITRTGKPIRRQKKNVKVRAISPAKTAETQNGGAPTVSKPPLPASRVATAKKDDLEDGIPF